jgi:hypothetical protein
VRDLPVSGPALHAVYQAGERCEDALDQVSLLSGRAFLVLVSVILGVAA